MSSVMLLASGSLREWATVNTDTDTKSQHEARLTLVSLLLTLPLIGRCCLGIRADLSAKCVL